MKKINVIYWSGTGNTQKMAEAITDGAKLGGAETKLLEVGEATIMDVLDADAVALGCPSMGCEILEEEEMEPFVNAFEREGLVDKTLALFGSYDWGDGQWMRDWEARMKAAGANLLEEGLIIQNTPDDSGLQKCAKLGQKLSEA
ncbi:MAG: flavodoxin [Clostridia bacterium BRH_c25]|nr:MAG: flavodoxin [Clostridia bacterium BRH_c25]